MWSDVNSYRTNYSKLQYNNTKYLHYREVKGILLHQGFPRPISPATHPGSSEEWIVGKIGQGSPHLFVNLISKKKELYTSLSSFHMKLCTFVHHNFTELVVILILLSQGTLSTGYPTKK